jgi:hypothetical protein
MRPVIEELTKIMKVSVENWKESKIKGAIFCQVSIKVAWNHEMNSIIWGNQKWNGAIPAFIERAIVIKIPDRLIAILRWKNIRREVKMIIREAIAWVRKYLIAASVVGGFNLLRRRGINLIRLISRPSQAVNHEEEDTVKMVPAIKLVKNM